MSAFKVVFAGHRKKLGGFKVVCAVGGGQHPSLVNDCGAADVVSIPVVNELQRHLPWKLVCENTETSFLCLLSCFSIFQLQTLLMLIMRNPEEG